MVLNLLVVPIQNDLNITDTQISALQGLAFVLTYVGLCIPIGRLIDRSHRVTVMIIGLLIWSIATIACGFSKNYVKISFPQRNPVFHFFGRPHMN